MDAPHVRKTMKLNRLAHVLAAGAAVALVAGCSPSPANAAVINGQNIRESKVDATIEGCMSVGAMTEGPDLRRAVVENLIVMEGSHEVARQQDLDISESSINEMVQGNPGLAAYMDDEACGDYIRGDANTFLVLQEVDPQTFLEAMHDMDIQVNPKYGQWSTDPTPGAQFPIGIQGSGSISGESEQG